MKLVTRLLLFSCLLLACQKQGIQIDELDTCQLAEPTTELDWLAEKINSHSASACLETLHQYDFRNGTVFVLRCGIQSLCLCNAAAVWDCDGEELFRLSTKDGGMSEQDFLDEATNERLLWENK